MAWVAGHRTRLLRSAYLLTGDRAQAEGLVQEAVIKVAERWGRLRSGHPTAYARTIIVHDHASWWRRRRESPSADLVGDSAVPETDHAGRSVLISALGELPRRCLHVILEEEWEHHRYAVRDLDAIEAESEILGVES